MWHIGGGDVKQPSASSGRVVREIPQVTRKQYLTAEQEKIRIVLVGLRGEGSIAERTCPNCSKEFPDARKSTLAGNASPGGDVRFLSELSKSRSGIGQARP
jgi:hypothetical protein